MAWSSDPLWKALAAMRIEAGGAALTFAARLARENGWSAAHAAAVVEEYRRFLYLAATAGPVTPSEDVDQAWHLHLSYTRHYWEVLCGEIVGRPLHHDPTGGGRRERDRFRRQYEATLARYRAVFGTAPPPDIWPDAGTRFAARPLRIDAAHYWLVPRRTPGRAAAVAGAAILVAACTSLAANSAGASGPMVVSILLLITVVAGGLALTLRNSNRKKGDGDCSGGVAGCSGDGHHGRDGGDGGDGDGGGDGGGNGGGDGGGGGCGGGCGGD